MRFSTRTTRTALSALGLALAMGATQAAEEGQNMPGQIQDDDYYNDLLKDSEASGNDPYLTGGGDSNKALQQPAEEEVKPLQDPKFFQGMHTTDPGTGMPGSQENSNNYIEYKNSEIVTEFAKQGKSSVGFAYIADDYEYKDPGNVHKRTYQDSSKAKSPGSLQFSSDYFIFRSFVEAYWGGNLSIGYQTGTGRFADGAESYAEFQLWAIPFDLGVGLALPIGNWFKLAVDGGPSVMGLMQSRSDKESGEKFKRRRQISPGYYAEAKAGVSLSRLIPALGKAIYHDYKATQFFLNFVARTHNYENFQDEFQISGSSYGVQFTFEYL